MKESREKDNCIKISVVMGVYNIHDKDVLYNAVRSILDQTFTDFEFIIYNDTTLNNLIIYHVIVIIGPESSTSFFFFFNMMEDKTLLKNPWR